MALSSRNTLNSRAASLSLKRFLAISIFASVLITPWFFSVSQTDASGSISKIINFQGKITKTADGTNVTDGTYAVQFKIYSALTAGSLLWTETYDQASGACTKLQLTSGVFNAKLGSCNALNIDFTTGSLYLSINFAPSGTSYDGEMSPRKQLNAAAYAFSANNLAGDGRIDLAYAPSTSTFGGAAIDYSPSVSAANNAMLLTAGANVTGAALNVIQSGSGGAILVGASALAGSTQTYIGANPTAFSGNFMDLQLNGTSEFKVSSAGVLTLGTALNVANGGTGSSSFSGTNGVTYYDGTKLVSTAASIGAQCLQTASAGSVPIWGTCGAATSWSGLTAPTTNLSLAMQSFTTTLTYGATTGSSNLFTLADTASNTGTGNLFNITTATSSAVNPLSVSAAGSATPSLFVASSGNVGIVTSAPTHTLTLGSTSTGISYYNTSDQTTNYERVLGSWVSNVFTLQTQNGGTGTLRSIALKGGSVNITPTNGGGTGVTVGLTNTTVWDTGSNNSTAAIQSTAKMGSLVGAVGYGFAGNGQIASTSGTGLFFNLTPSYNQATGTAANTDFLINRTETAVGSGAQLFVDLQVSGTSRFNISNKGAVTINGSAPASVATNGTAAANSLTVNGAAGGASSGTTGQTGGTGAAISETAGAGGAVAGASGIGGAGGTLTYTSGAGGAGAATNGNGGLITIQGGAAGAGAGTAGSRGNISLQASGGNVGIGTNSPGSPLDLQTTKTIGNIFSVSSSSVVSLTGTLYGINTNLSNFSGATGFSVFGKGITLPTDTNINNATKGGIALTIPAYTQATGAATGLVDGLQLNAPGAATTSTAAGTLNWNGLDITTPTGTANFAGSTLKEDGLKVLVGSITQTAGTATSNGIELNMSATTITTGGTVNGLLITPPTTLPAVGIVNAVNIGTSTSATANTFDNATISIGNSSSTATHNTTSLTLQNGGSGNFDLELVRGFINFQQMNTLYDDFTGKTLDTNKWTTTVLGTGACPTTPTAAGLNGFLTIATGTSAGNGCAIGTQATPANGYFQRGDNPVFETKINTSNAAAGVRIFAGFTSATLSNIDTSTAAHAWIEKTAAGTQFICDTSDGTTETNTAFGPTIVAGTYYRLRVEVLSGTTPSVVCTIDDGAGNITRISKTTNIPLAATAMDVYVNSNTSDITTESVKIDYIRAWQDEPATDAGTVQQAVVAPDAPVNSVTDFTVNGLSTTAYDQPTIQSFFDRSATLSKNSQISQFYSDRLTAGLEIITPKITVVGLTVDTIGSLHDAVSFATDVQFIGRPYFNNDSAGFAQIKQGDQSVSINFVNPYLTQPVVSATITSNGDSSSQSISDQQQAAQALFNSGLQYAVIAKSQNGFVIYLNKPATQDIQFSWIAIAVKDAKTFSSQVNNSNSDSSTAPVITDSNANPIPPQTAQAGE